MHTPTGPYCAPLYNSASGRYSQGQGFPLQVSQNKSTGLRTLIQEQQLLLERILNNQQTHAALDERLSKIESSSVSALNLSMERRSDLLLMPCL